MDFNVSADPPQVVGFRKEVSAWLAEEFKGFEHLRWSASWSTREDDQEYKFRRGLAEKLGAKGWLFPLYPKKYGGAELTVDHQMVLETELFKYGLNLSHTFYTLARIVAPVLIRWGTEEQKAEFKKMQEDSNPFKPIGDVLSGAGDSLSFVGKNLKWILLIVIVVSLAYAYKAFKS